MLPSSIILYCLVQAPYGCDIEMYFAKGEFGVYCDEKAGVCMQWVELRYRANLASPGPRYVCSA